MASPKPLQDFELHESWEELQFHPNPEVPSEVQFHPNEMAAAEPTIDAPQGATIHHENIEKLLIEAQRESRTPSHGNSKESSARGSPKSPPSPNSDYGEGRVRQDPGLDWIWDWSSRPEIQPSSDLPDRLRHPIGKPRRLPAKVQAKQGIFHLDNIKSLLMTHACTFFLGAACMLLFLKKYCHWGAVVTSSLD